MANLITPQQYVEHRFQYTPSFQRLWKNINLRNERFSIGKNVQVNAEEIEREITQEYDELKSSGPGYKWAQFILGIENIKNHNYNEQFIEQNLLKEHVKHADLSRRMLRVAIESKISIDSNLMTDIYATAGLGLSFIFACMGEYSAAVNFFKPTFDFVDDGTDPGDYSSDVVGSALASVSHGNENWYESHAIPARMQIIKMYNELRKLSEKTPGLIDMGFNGKPDSYTHRFSKLIKQEKYEELAALSLSIKNDITSPLERLSNDLQIFLPAKLLSLYFLKENPQFKLTQNGIDINNGRFYVTNNQGLEIKCSPDDYSGILSILHQDKYVHVFPRFEWKIK